MGPRAGLDRRGKSRPTRIRSQDRPVRSESPYRLRYPGPATRARTHARTHTHTHILHGVMFQKTEIFVIIVVMWVQAKQLNLKHNTIVCV